VKPIGRHRTGQAPVPGVVPEDDLDRPARQDQGATRLRTCGPSDALYSYGLGIVTTGNWLLQNPLFSGEAGVFAYLPSQKVAIALTVTFSQDAFAADGSYKPEVTSNAADAVWREIATVVAPNDPLQPKGRF
jgi:hypothetical protein